MTQDTNTAIGVADLLSLIDSYAEARHVGGCHTYNARTAAARNVVVAALASAAAPQPDTAYTALIDDISLGAIQDAYRAARARLEGEP